MKKYMYMAAALLVLAACAKEKEVNTEKGEVSLNATMEIPVDGQTKTALSGLNVVWTGTESINVFTSASENVQLTTTDSGSSAVFTGGGITGTPQYAIYPYASTNSISGSTITFTLPETQTYAANSFGQGANVSVGKISGSAVSFKNVCGVLKLSLSIASGDAANVGRIVLTDENNWLTGTFSADAEDANPTATYTGSDGGNTITLDCSAGSGVALSTTATDFYIVVPAGACSAGFTAEVYSKQNHLITTLNTAKNNSVSRATIKKMPEVADIPWLPAAYTECEYVQTNPSGAFNTEFRVDAEFSVDMDFALYNQNARLHDDQYEYFVPVGSWKYPRIAWIRFTSALGYANLTSGPEASWQNASAGTGTNLYTVAPYNYSYFTDDKIVNIYWVNKLTRRDLSIDGHTVSAGTTLASVPTDGLSRPLYIGGVAEGDGEGDAGSSAGYLTPMKLYECTIYNGSDVVVRRFIPILDGSNACLFEVSRTKTYSKTSTYVYTPCFGSFTAH